MGYNHGYDDGYADGLKDGAKKAPAPEPIRKGEPRLRLDGNAFCLTGIESAAGQTWIVDCAFGAKDGNSFAFGSCKSTGVSDLSLFMKTTEWTDGVGSRDKSEVLAAAGRYGSSTNRRVNAHIGNRYVFTNGQGSLTVESTVLDAHQEDSTVISTQDFGPGYDIAVGGRNVNGTVSGTMAGVIYSVKCIAQDGTVVLDLVPAEADGEGVFHDNVSGRNLKSIGTSKFIYEEV